MIILARDVRGSTRPAPVLGPLGQAGADRVERDIAQRADQMRLVHRHRAEAALPQMAGHAHPGIDVAGIVAVHVAEGAAETFLIARHGDDVNVVGHQAVGPDLDPCPSCRIRQQVEVQFVVAILEEGLLAAVAALRHVVRDAGEHDAWEAGHGWRLTRQSRTGNR